MSSAKEGGALFDNLTLDQVEEEIRRAEELLNRDSVTINPGGGKISSPNLNRASKLRTRLRR